MSSLKTSLLLPYLLPASLIVPLSRSPSMLAFCIKEVFCTRWTSAAPWPLIWPTWRSCCSLTLHQHDVIWPVQFGTCSCCLPSCTSLCSTRSPPVSQIAFILYLTQPSSLCTFGHISFGFAFIVHFRRGLPQLRAKNRLQQAEVCVWQGMGPGQSTSLKETGHCCDRALWCICLRTSLHLFQLFIEQPAQNKRFWRFFSGGEDLLLVSLT